MSSDVGHIQLPFVLQEGRKSLKWISGKKRGVDVRLACKIDELEAEYDKIEIIFPKETKSITTSFVLGLLSGSLDKLYTNNMSANDLRSAFFNKFSVVAGDEILKRSLIDDISEGVRDYLIVGRSTNV